MKKTFNKAFNIIPYLILMVSFLLLANVTVSLVKGNTPTIFGRGIFVISSGSMEDTLMTGDVIYVDTTDKEYIVGDIITFYADLDSNGTLEKVTHRIVDKTGDGESALYTTKGDNEETNPISNTWEIDITEDRIIGKYASKSIVLSFMFSLLPSEANGYVFNKSLIFVALIIVFVIVGAMEVSNIIKLLSKDKEEKALEEEKEKLVQVELERLRKEQNKKEE